MRQNEASALFKELLRRRYPVRSAGHHVMIIDDTREIRINTDMPQMRVDDKRVRGVAGRVTNNYYPMESVLEKVIAEVRWETFDLPVIVRWVEEQWKRLGSAQLV